MQCFSPIYVKNKSYSGCVPCGKCPACRQRRSNQWIFRLEQEARHSEGCLFLTLTYNEDCVPRCDIVDEKTGEISENVRVVDKSDIQKFFHDLRRSLYGDFGGSLRYFVCSEYGPTTLRPHYHVILFNFPNISSKYVSSHIEKAWKKGFVKVAPLNKNRIRYVCKYCLTDAYITYLPVFNMMSQGIGRDWLSPSIRYSYRHNPRLYTVDELGNKRSLHRYYIERLWPNKFTRSRVMFNLINEMYDEKRKTFESHSQDLADSFGYSYTVDGLQRFAPATGECIERGSHIVHGEVGAFLFKYQNSLKKSKFMI